PNARARTMLVPNATKNAGSAVIDQPEPAAPATVAWDLAGHNSAASVFCGVRHQHGSGTCIREGGGPVAMMAALRVAPVKSFRTQCRQIGTNPRCRHARDGDDLSRMTLTRNAD